jgi:hypothetical protein
MTSQKHPPATTAVVPSTSKYTDITAPDTARHDGWTRERMIGFLEALVETASVSVAAQSVGMSRRSAYYLRARLMGQPFDLAWDAALEFGLQQLHHEALDRAMNGVAVPIFYGGEEVGERRVYPESLTRFLLDNPNARGRREGVNRAAALNDWNGTMKRVQTGPIVWTPAETKQAKRVAGAIRAELDKQPPPARASTKTKPARRRFVDGHLHPDDWTAEDHLQFQRKIANMR